MSTPSRQNSERTSSRTVGWVGPLNANCLVDEQTTSQLGTNYNEENIHLLELTKARRTTNRPKARRTQLRIIFHQINAGTKEINPGVEAWHESSPGIVDSPVVHTSLSVVGMVQVIRSPIYGRERGRTGGYCCAKAALVRTGRVHAFPTAFVLFAETEFFSIEIFLDGEERCAALNASFFTDLTILSYMVLWIF